MHRRARHLNPGSAGAVLALDSRFISGLSDGDPVSTWSDRTASGNNVTQTGSARPTYETFELNGNPSVRFSPTQTLKRDAVTIATALTAIMTTKFPTGLRNHVCFEQAYQNSPSQGRAIAAVDGSYNFWDSNELFMIDGGYTTSRGVDWSPYSNISGASIQLYGMSSLRHIAKLNGVFVGSQKGTPQSLASLTGPLIFGSTAGTIRVQHDFFNLQVFEADLSNSLIRRLEHAAAFAFKIPCS